MAFELNGYDDRNVFRSVIKSYICTSTDDIDKLPRYKIPGTQVLNDGFDDRNNAPCGLGSTANVRGDGVYILWPDNIWAKMN